MATVIESNSGQTPKNEVHTPLDVLAQIHGALSAITSDVSEEIYPPLKKDFVAMLTLLQGVKEDPFVHIPEIERSQKYKVKVIFYTPGRKKRLAITISEKAIDGEDGLTFSFEERRNRHEGKYISRGGIKFIETYVRGGGGRSGDNFSLAAKVEGFDQDISCDPHMSLQAFQDAHKFFTVLAEAVRARQNTPS